MTSDETLRMMAERIERMFENLRYAEAGVIVHRYVPGLRQA